MVFDYQQLQTDIQLWMENNSLELQTAIVEIPNIAMQTISKDIRLKTLNSVVTNVSMTANSELVAIPNVGQMVALRSVAFNDTGTHYTRLRKKNLTYIEEYWPDYTQTGTPKYYGDYDATNWVVVPTPASNFPMRISTKQQLAPLVNPTDTNSIITNHYDFALTACLLEASRFVIDDRQVGLIQVNGGRYTDLRNMINELAKRIERDESQRPDVDSGNAPSAASDSEAE